MTTEHTPLTDDDLGRLRRNAEKYQICSPPNMLLWGAIARDFADLVAEVDRLKKMPVLALFKATEQDRQRLLTLVKSVRGHVGVFDFPTAFATVAPTDTEQHHERCSYRQTDRGVLCDCAAITAASAAWDIATQRPAPTLRDVLHLVWRHGFKVVRNRDRDSGGYRYWDIIGPGRSEHGYVEYEEPTPGMDRTAWNVHVHGPNGRVVLMRHLDPANLLTAASQAGLLDTHWEAA